MATESEGSDDGECAEHADVAEGAGPAERDADPKGTATPARA